MDKVELTWERVQDIWFITDRLLHSIPEDFNKWEEWMFNTQGRFEKALEEINKYWESKQDKNPNKSKSYSENLDIIRQEIERRMNDAKALGNARESWVYWDLLGFLNSIK